MNQFESIKTAIFGDRDQISSERYFVTVTTIVSFVFLSLLCVVHMAMSLKFTPVLFAGSSAIVTLVLYYFVRFHTCLFIPKIILTTGGLLMLDYTWYSKYLSNGPVLFFILMFAALVIWVWEGKPLVVILGLYFININILYRIDISAPEYLFKYPSAELRSRDIFLSLFLYSSLLVFLLYVVKREFLRQKEKAIKSDQLKSAFLANMSHEIRTPMNGILGFSELLKNPDLSGAKQQEYIRIIENSGTRMLNIINDIIDISKIEANLMKLDINESNINEQMEYIYTFFKPEVEARGMLLSYKNSLPDEEAILTTDREKVYAILTNLVKNAIKYSLNGTIEFGYTVINQPAQRKELQFYIKDTGIGIPKDRLEAIFERFIQADITDVKAHQGAGLGLSITKAYVEMLGGRIWVESVIEKGSTFYFTLPYNIIPKEKKMRAEPQITEAENHMKKLKILIAEDDKVSEVLISIIVKNYSREILKARTGSEAVEACRNHPDIDIVLLDIQMPDMGGYEAAKEIRQFNKKVILIAQTASGFSGDRSKAIESGCNDYITKPIDKIKLIELFQKYFNQYEAATQME